MTFTRRILNATRKTDLGGGNALQSTAVASYVLILRNASTVRERESERGK